MSPKLLVRMLAALALAGLGSATDGATPAKPEEAARAYLLQQRHESGLSLSDLGDLVVSSVVPSKHNGVTHVYLQQRHAGIEVHGAIANVNVGADGRVISAGNRLVPGLAAAAGRPNVRKSAVEAAAAAAPQLNLRATQRFEVLARRAGADRPTTLSDGGIAVRPIEAKLVWLPVGEKVKLAWRLEIEERSGDHWWYALVDARTGELVFREDLVVQDSPLAIARAVARPTASRRTQGEAPEFPVTDGALYNVFPLPFESPSDGAALAGRRVPPTRRRRPSAGTTRTARPEPSSPSPAATTYTPTPTATTTTWPTRAATPTAARRSTSTSRST